MSCGSYLQILQGDSYSFSSNVTVDNVAQNIAGATISFYAMAALDNTTGPQEIININSAGGQISIGGNNNSQITVSMNSDFTANITLANVGSWFLRAETTGLNVYTLDRGRLCVMPGFAPLPL